jgi:hypothetical protein
MAAVLCVLAPRAVGQNQVVPAIRQEPYDGRLNLFNRQRRLVWSIIKVRHLALRIQLLQDAAKFWRAVRIRRSAKSHDTPKKLRMGQYVTAAPEYFVVRVGDDNRRLLPGA